MWRWMICGCWVLIALVQGAVAVAAPDAPPAGEKSTGTIVLDNRTPWRAHAVLSPAVYEEAGQTRALADLADWTVEKLVAWQKNSDLAFFGKMKTGKGKTMKRFSPPDQPNLPLPPSDWACIEFDDTGWWRKRPPFYFGGHRNTRDYGAGLAAEQALLCLRAKFTVTDPSKVKDLALSTSYRGGLVVYLNGKEAGRSHMAAGEIGPGTLAEVYPWEVYLTPEGKGLGTSPKHIKNFKDRLDKRIRNVSGLSLPVGLLMKGTNVLALEIHRAPRRIDDKGVHHGGWGTVALRSAQLVTTSAEGVQPNVSRPDGIQVWNADLLEGPSIRNYGDPHDPLLPVRIVGTPNGVFSGLINVSSGKEIVGLRSEITDLKGDTAVIPASAIQIRYPRDRIMHEKPPEKVHFNARKRKTQKNVGAIQQIWVTVRVPVDTAAGTYRGELTVSAGGAEPVKVSVELTVCTWKLPDPRDFHTIMDFVQSTDTLPLYYKVPLWSDRHFELIGKTFEILGEIGNNSVYIPLLTKTHFGNEQTMVRWIKQPGGTYRYDYSVMERYLDLARKHMDVRVVGLYVWEYYMSLAPGNKAGKHKSRRALVSCLDPATGAVTEMEGPAYNDPDAAAFWKPVVNGVRERLEKRGLEKAMMLYVTGDLIPSKETVALWGEISPGTPWISHAHGLRTALHDTRIGLTTTAYGVRYAVDPALPRKYGWRMPAGMLSGEFARWRRYKNHRADFKLLVEWNVSGNLQGLARMNADFWGVPTKDKKGRTRPRSVIDRFGLNHYINLSLGFQGPLLRPGPDGAVWTMPFELIREGIQESEARIYMEKALLDEDLRAKLGEEAAGRYQALLDERTRYNLWTGVGNYCTHTPTQGRLGLDWYVGTGWQERSRKLFDAAGEMAKKLGSR